MDKNRGIWRGKRKDNGKWIEGDCVHTNSGRCFIKIRDFKSTRACDDIFEVDNETLGECTGLKDQNHKLIFEGDIVHAIYDIGYGGVKATDFGNGVVEYHGSYYSGARWEMNIIGESGCRVFSASVKCEVIGNIHDNPELLKAATGEDIGNAAQDTFMPAT